MIGVHVTTNKLDQKRLTKCGEFAAIEQVLSCAEARVEQSLLKGTHDSKVGLIRRLQAALESKTTTNLFDLEGTTSRPRRIGYSHF